MRLLGIDYGMKRIGIALSDEEAIFAFPHSVIENCPSKKCAEEAVKKIKEICGANNVGKIVLGKSVDYKDRPNPIMEKITPFKTLLEKEISLPVVYQSEVLTTKESLRAPGRIGPRGNVSRKRAEWEIKKNDASAAALILRSFIEKGKVLK